MHRHQSMRSGQHYAPDEISAWPKFSLEHLFPEADAPLLLQG